MKNIDVYDIPTHKPVYYRTYSRITSEGKERIEETFERGINGIVELGKLDSEEETLVRETVTKFTSTLSGRWLWVGGTDWIKQPENFMGAYNCCGLPTCTWKDFALNFDNLHNGCGVGTTITDEEITSLPSILNRIKLEVTSEPGEFYSKNVYQPKANDVDVRNNKVYIKVSDSRKGWTDAYQTILELSSNPELPRELEIYIDFGYIRPAGTPIKGFGGVANPGKLVEGFAAIVQVLNTAARESRQLTGLEIILLLNWAGVIAVAGNIRRSARINQADSNNAEFTTCKDNLWTQDAAGNWRIDPLRDALRYANHTRLFYTKPTKEEIETAIKKQYYSSEGAIMYVPEAVARCNVDLLDTPEKKDQFLLYFEQGGKESAKTYLALLLSETKDINSEGFAKEIEHRINRFNLNPCLAAGTLVLTKDGTYPIEELVGKTVEVWDGENWVTVDNFRVTGENKKVYKLYIDLVLGDGCGDVIDSWTDSITATDNHTFILSNGDRKYLHQLKPGDILKTHSASKYEISEAYVSGWFYEEIVDKVYCCTVPTTHAFALANGILVGQCAEILG